MKSVTKIKYPIKSHLTEDASGNSNVTVTLPTIHVTEVQNEVKKETLKELPTEVVYNTSSSSTAGSYHQIDKICYLNPIYLSSTSQISHSDEEILPGELRKSSRNIIRIPTAPESPIVQPIQSKVPKSFDQALDIVANKDVMFYLAFKTAASDVHFNPYDFKVVARKPLKNYAILSHEGLLRIFNGEVTLVTRSQFIEERIIYDKLRKLSFFRHFRLRVSWSKWRRCVRTKRVQEAKKSVFLHLLPLKPEANIVLTKVAEICHELSNYCLVKFPDDRTEAQLLQDWVENQLKLIQATQLQFKNLRSLLLQILVSTLKLHTDEGGESEIQAGDDSKGTKSSPRSLTGSSCLTRRHIPTTSLKIVRICDMMMANALRSLLHNSLLSTLDNLKGNQSAYSKTHFKIQIVTCEGSVKCSPTFDGFLSGIQTVLKACEFAVLSCQPLIPYFTERDQPMVEQNLILQSMLKEDLTYRRNASGLKPLMKEIWFKVEGEILPISTLCEDVNKLESENEQTDLTKNDLSDLGGWLGNVANLLLNVKDVSDTKEAHVMLIERAPVKAALVEILRKQQQFIHQFVTKTFESRVEKLAQEATDCWLGLESSPVTGHQLVTLLNYVNRVKTQMEILSKEETVMVDMHSLILSHEIVISPEAQAKYDALRKDMRRLKKTLRRNVMERPGLVSKLKTLLEKEVKDLDKETEKLSEQVNALRFLRITSDRSEVLKMLSAAENRGINIRSQAIIIAQYQKDFKIAVSPFENLLKVESEIKQKTHLWRSLFEWEAFVEIWQESEIQTLDWEEIQTTATDYRNRIVEIQKVISNSEVLDHFDRVVQQIEAQIPIIKSLTDPALRPRHWRELKESVGKELSLSLTLAMAEEFDLISHKKILIEVSMKANKQKQMEDKLSKVSKELEKVTVPMIPSYKKDIYVLGNLCFLTHLLMECQLTFYELLHSSFATHIKENAIKWKNILILLQKTLQALETFERKWQVLEPVMTSRSATECFPLQAAIFESANLFWKSVVARFEDNPVFVYHIKGGQFLELLLHYSKKLDSLMTCLEPLLAVRRDTCPRLYFLPDLELLNLLTKLKDPDTCEKYLPALFPGLSSLKKSADGNIIALVSPQQEILRLSKSVLAHHGVEDWLGRVESGMKATLKRMICSNYNRKQDHADYDLPIQVIDVCRRIKWNMDVKKNLRGKGDEKKKQFFESLIKEINDDIQNILNQNEIPDFSELESIESEETFSKSNQENLLSTVSRLKTLQRIRKITMFHNSKSLEATLQQSNIRKQSKDMLHQKELLKIARKEETDHLKKELYFARRESALLTLIELRNSTSSLIQNDVTTASCLSWLSQPRHEITSMDMDQNEEPLIDPKHIGRVGLYLQTGAESLEYGFEYLGVDQFILRDALTDRVTFNLVMTANNSKCGTLVGDASSNKTNTMKKIANSVGQNLCILNCSHLTPEKTIRQILSGGVQGGFWVLLKEPQFMSSVIISNIAESLISIYRTRESCAKKCIIGGQEMKLSDSFALFFSITSASNDVRSFEPTINAIASESLQSSYECIKKLFRHPVTPFLKSVPSMLPPLEAVIESVFLTKGFNLKKSFRQSLRYIYEESLKFAANEQLNSSYIRLLPLIALKAMRMKNESFKLLEINCFKELRSEELLVLHCSYSVIEPLIEECHLLPWQELFSSLINDGEELTDRDNLFFFIANLEKINRKNIFDPKVVGKKDNFFEIIKRNLDSKILSLVLAHVLSEENVSTKNLEADDYQEELDPKIRRASQMLNRLTHEQTVILNLALQLYSLLTTHSCAWLVETSNDIMNQVWKTLKTALNRLLMEKKCRQFLEDKIIFSEDTNQEDLLAKQFVTTTTLFCGSYEESQIIGCGSDETDEWTRGAILERLAKISKDLSTSYGCEQWLILFGPFPSKATLDFISNLCPPSSTASDQGLCCVQMPVGLKIIILTSSETKMPENVLERVPILKQSLTTSDFKVELPDDFKDAFQQLESKYLSDIPSSSKELAIRKCLEFSFDSVREKYSVEEFENALKELHKMRLKRATITNQPLKFENVFGQRTIVTNEIQETLRFVAKMTLAQNHIFLLSKKGAGLSTFLNYTEHHLRKNCLVLRFKYSLTNIHDSLLAFLKHHMYEVGNKAFMDKDGLMNHGGDRVSIYDYNKNEITLVSPRKTVLIVETIIWDEKEHNREILENFRAVLEYGVLIDRKTGIEYRIKNISLIICCSLLKDNFSLLSYESFLPNGFFKNCFFVTLPDPNEDMLNQLFKSELEDTFTEESDEGKMLAPLKESTVRIHVLLNLREDSKFSLSNVEKSCLGKLLNLVQDSTETELHPLVNIQEPPTLATFSRFVKSLKRCSGLLTMSPAEIGSLFCIEISRIYSSSSFDEQILRELSEHVIAKYMEEEPDKKLYWLPTRSSLDKITIHSNYKFKEILEPHQGNFSNLLFSQSLFKSLQDICFTLMENDPTRHLIVLGSSVVGKASLVKIGVSCSSTKFYNLSEENQTRSQIKMIEDAIQNAAMNQNATAIFIRLRDLKSDLMQILDALLKHGKSDMLWSVPEMTGILLRLRKSKETHGHSWANYIDEEEMEKLQLQFLRNIQKYLRICLTGTQQEFTLAKQEYPITFHNCSVINVNDWSFNTLQETASQILDHAQFSQSALQGSLKALAISFEAFSHGFSNQIQWEAIQKCIEEDGEEDGYDVEELQHCEEVKDGINGLTCSDFLECCRAYNKLLTKRKNLLKDELAMFEGGLMRLDSTTDNIEELKTELSQLEPELKNTQEEALKLTGAIGQQRTVVAELRSQMNLHEDKVKDKNEYLVTLNDEINLDIKEAMPELESSEKQIKVLDKKDLVEVRVLNKPPDLVLQVMSAICLLLNVKSDWPAIKTLLGEPNMTKRLLEIDKDSLNEVTLRKLRKFIEYPKFTPEEVGKMSKPCKPLCAWLKAVDSYAQVLRSVEPKRAKVVETERDYNNLLFEQRQLQQKLGQAERGLSEQGARYDACICRRQQLEGAVKKASGRLQRCTRLASVLADEHSRWSKQVDNLKEKLSCVYGECLLAAYTVAFLGHVKPKIRKLILNICIALLKKCGIKIIKKNFKLLNNLCTPEEQLVWTDAGMYKDPTPIVQAAILFATHRPPLVLDTNQAFVPWLKAMYDEKEGVEIIQPNTKTFRKQFLAALDTDKKIVMIHIPMEALSNEVQQLLNLEKAISKRSSIFFVTESSRRVPSDLRASVTLVSFAVSPRVLEEQLLNQVLARERADLYEQQDFLTAAIKKDEDSLAGVDLSILKRLSEATIGLLDNEELLAAFYEAKSASAEYRTRLAESKRTMQKIGNARDKYRPVASRGRVLFSSLGALGKLLKEYIFSLGYFLKLFAACILSGADEEVAMSFDQRIESLVQTLTKRVASHVTRSMRPSHRLIFLTCLAAAIQHEDGLLTINTWKVILQKEITDVEKYLKRIYKADEEMLLISHMLIEGNPVQILLYDLQTEISLAGIKDKSCFTPKKLTDFNALLLLRLHRPRLLLLGAKEVVKNVLGDSSILDAEPSIKELLESNTDRELGLLLWTNYSNDVITEILSCAREKGLEGMTKIIVAHNQSGIKRDPGAADVSSAITSAIPSGQWIIIQECSFKSLLPQILNQMTRITENDIKTHENFRLILTSRLDERTTTDENLILMARPLQVVPSSDFQGILKKADEAMSKELYGKHYQGALWRRILWLAAAVHTVTYVSQIWNCTNKLQENTFNDWIQLKDIEETYHVLYQLSLKVRLSEHTVIGILDILYGHRDIWSSLVTEENIGIDDEDNLHTLAASCIQSLGSRRDSIDSKKRPLESKRSYMDLRKSSSKSRRQSIDSRILSVDSKRQSSRSIDSRQSKPLLTHSSDSTLVKGSPGINSDRTVKLKSSIPHHVGTISRESAYQTVLVHLNENFQELNNRIVDREFIAFRRDFSTVSEELMKDE